MQIIALEQIMVSFVVMDEAVAELKQDDQTLRKPSIVSREIVWFVSMTALVWLLMDWTIPWFGGRYYYWILPYYQDPVRTSSLQFLFSHLFEFSFIPGFAAGLLNPIHRQRSVQFIWIIPAIALVYRVATFSPATSSVFTHSSGLAEAIRYYFGRAFKIGEWSTYSDLFSLAASNPDVFRGMAQMHTTGPFYGTLGYSIGTAVMLHTNARERIRTTFISWYRREVPTEKVDVS